MHIYTLVQAYNKPTENVQVYTVGLYERVDAHCSNSVRNYPHRPLYTTKLCRTTK